MHTNAQKGFSLIELLIVVVIIGIIAAIAVPQLLAARRSANEGSAVSAVRNLHSAQLTFAATTGSGDYAPSLLELGPGVGGAGIIDRSLSLAAPASSGKSGFVFLTTPDNAVYPRTFIVTSAPLISAASSVVTGTGLRKFGVTQVGMIYAGPADAASTHYTAAELTAFDSSGPVAPTVNID